MGICHRVAAAAQFFRRAFHFAGGPRSPALRADRPFGFWHLQSAFRCFAKTLAPSLGKMPVIRRLTRRESFGGLNEQVILQDVERRLVRRLRFFVAPGPKLAKNRAREAGEFACAGNSPRLLVIARTLDQRLLERARARLPEPVHSLAFA